MRVPVINNSMRLDRFFKIRQSIKVLNDLDVSERVRGQPRLVKLNRWFPSKAGVLYGSLCQGKPNPTARKVFLLASPCGLVLDFEVYKGHNWNWRDGTVSSKMSTPVLWQVFHLCLNTGYVEYNGLLGTGTNMKNRIPALFKSKMSYGTKLQRQGRGKSEMVVRKPSEVANECNIITLHHYVLWSNKTRCPPQETDNKKISK